MTALSSRVRLMALLERLVTLRLPFRFGAATVTRYAQAFVRDGLRDITSLYVPGYAHAVTPQWDNLQSFS